jgi:DNA-binding winged helix-turn-helix (wHTH) protein/tetratricopeptide (TPR) repeat protein
MADTEAVSNPLHVRFAEFELDERNARLIHNGRVIPLSPTPFELLCTLVRHAGSLLTKHALLDEVWGHRFVSDSVLKGTISDIRTALNDDARTPRFIETAARRGYRFIAVPVTVQTAASASRSAGPASARAPVEAEETPADWSVGSAPGNSPLFIGREGMLAALHRSWQRASTGRRAIVWVAGDPGVGKSSLVERFAASVGDELCVRGQCVQQHGSGEPYHPVLEALAELSKRDVSVPALLRAVAPTWLLQLPWLSTAEEREALRRGLVGAHPERMLRELGELLDRYTRNRRLLLITEDLHWADRPTLQLIEFLARRRTDARLMWISTLRLTDIVVTEHPLNTLRRELLLHGLCEEVVLDSFSEAEVGQYLAERWPELGTDESLVRAVHQRTEGVPLFIASMVSDIAARATASGVSAAAMIASSPVPDRLLAIIEHYASQLGDEQRTLLSSAAVCGVQFRVDVLAKVLQRDADVLAEECAQLVRGRLWLAAYRSSSPGDGVGEGYSFRHALFRDVLYDRLASSARADLHRRVATVLQLERTQDPTISAAQLATHFELGRSPLDALRFYAEAAETALLQLSPGECLRLTELALAILPRAPASTERVSLELTLATLRGLAAFHVLGTGDAAREAYLRASKLLADQPLHRLRGSVVHGAGYVLNLRGELSEALRTADRAIELAARTGDPVLTTAALAVRGHTFDLQGKPSDSREALERALAALDSAGPDSAPIFAADLRASLLAWLSVPLTHLGLIDEARKSLAQAYALAAQLAQPVSSLVTMWYDALVQVRLGNTERLAVLAEQMSALVEKHAIVQGTQARRWFKALADARSGRADDTFRRIRAGYEENAALGMVAGGSETLGYAAEALLLRGDFDGAEQQLAEAFRHVDRYGERVYFPQLLLLEAAIADGRKDAAAAAAALRRSLEEARSQRAPWLELTALAEICKRPIATADERRALRSLVAALPEELDAPLYTRAKALLARRRH